MATKNAGKEIKLHGGRYAKEIFPYFLRNYKNRPVFISLIAFVRNIVDYTDSKDCDDYKTLTSCLHLMEATAPLQVKHIHDIYVRRLAKLNGKAIDFGEESVVDFILNTANDICAEQNIDEVMLENKISLAIAIRLKAEEYLISKLPEVNLNTITSNQTNTLYQAYRVEFPSSPALLTLEKVNLMTPENIHINAFMYEPLIDMSVYHLRDLYIEVSGL